MNRTLKIRPFKPVASLAEVAAMVDMLANRPCYGRLCVVQQSDGLWYVAFILDDVLDAQKKRCKRAYNI